MSAHPVRTPSPRGEPSQRSSRGAPAPAPRQAETTTVHTRLLRCMLAVDDCHAYWRRADLCVPTEDRARVAFEQRWFGTKSEARVRTILTDMIERFDAFPEALALLQELPAVPARLRPWICHVHTQLADPIYRRFTADFLPARREQGLDTVDRSLVSRWVDEAESGRWAASTCRKFASNLLATAHAAGLVSGRHDPRRIDPAPVPEAVVGYALYLLRDIHIDGTLLDNPYLRSLGVRRGTFRSIADRIPGIRFDELGGAVEIGWLEPGLRAWGRRYLGGAA